MEFIPDPEKMIEATLEHIDKKRAALGLPEYDPTRFGRSGDAEMIKLEALPLAEKRKADLRACSRLREENHVKIYRYPRHSRRKRSGH